MMTPTEMGILDWLVTQGQYRSRSEAIREAVQLQAIHIGLQDTEDSMARDERRDHPPKRRGAGKQSQPHRHSEDNL